MKASKLLNEIKNNLKDYNIDYLKNKATDNRYKDELTISLAKYNSDIYDEIFSAKIDDDFEIDNEKIKKLKHDIDYYFLKYNPHDPENQNLTKYLSLYLAFIAGKPLHPYGNNHNDFEVFKINDNFYCKGKVKFIKEPKSLCKYCPCKNAPFGFY